MKSLIARFLRKTAPHFLLDVLVLLSTFFSLKISVFSLSSLVYFLSFIVLSEISRDFYVLIASRR